MSSSEEGEQLLMLIYAKEESQQNDYVEVNCTNVMSKQFDCNFCSSQQDCEPFFTLMENDTDYNGFGDIAMKPIEETERTSEDPNRG